MCTECCWCWINLLLWLSSLLKGINNSAVTNAFDQSDQAIQGHLHITLVCDGSVASARWSITWGRVGVLTVKSPPISLDLLHVPSILFVLSVRAVCLSIRSASCIYMFCTCMMITIKHWALPSEWTLHTLKTAIIPTSFHWPKLFFSS